MQENRIYKVEENPYRNFKAIKDTDKECQAGFLWDSFGAIEVV